MTAVFSAALAAGCGAQARGESTAGGWPAVGDDGIDDGAIDDGDEPDGDGGDASSGGGDDGDGGGGDGDGVRLDVPDGETADGAGDGDESSSCTKIDLLLVIDGSISMDVAQDKLATSLDSFLTAIETELVNLADYRIGVVTTTDYPYNADGCHAPGSLVSRTGGPSSSDAVCGPFAQGGAWISSEDGDIAAKFSCIAGIGVGNGNVELTAQAIIGAITGDGPGGCNAGFIRDDALLVIVNITDTDDPSAYPPGQGSTGEPSGWFAAMSAAKGGVESNVVMISILPPHDPTCVVEGNWSPLVGGALDAPRLDELTRKFTHHFVGDICADDYGVLLGQALAEIEAGCDEFMPAG